MGYDWMELLNEDWEMNIKSFEPVANAFVYTLVGLGAALIIGGIVAYF